MYNKTRGLLERERKTDFPENSAPAALFFVDYSHLEAQASLLNLCEYDLSSETVTGALKDPRVVWTVNGKSARAHGMF